MAKYVLLGSPATNTKAAELLSAVKSIRGQFSVLQAEAARMSAMITGSSIAEVATVYGVQQSGFADVATAAQYLFDELNSAVGNSAALLQLLSELG